MNERPHYLLLDADSGARLGQAAAVPGLSAWECLDRAGLRLRTTCRGSTICGLCRVEVMEGGEALPPVQPDEAMLLGEAPGAWRLACRIRLPPGQARLVLRARGVTRAGLQ